MGWHLGIVEPWLHSWEPELSKRKSEILGFGRFDQHHPKALEIQSGCDQYGYGVAPVAGHAACARRGCSGCCYCRGQPPLPIHLEVCELLPQGCKSTAATPHHLVKVIDGEPWFPKFDELSALEWHSLCDEQFADQYGGLIEDFGRPRWITLDELREAIRLRSSGQVGALCQHLLLGCMHACPTTYSNGRGMESAQLEASLWCQVQFAGMWRLRSLTHGQQHSQIAVYSSWCSAVTRISTYLTATN